MAKAKRGKLTEAGGVLSGSARLGPEDADLGGGVEGVHGAIRRKPGPKPDPTRRGLKKYLLKLKPEHAAALHAAAAQRVVAGKASRIDGSEVLRLILDGWIGKGAKAP